MRRVNKLLMAVGLLSTVVGLGWLSRNRRLFTVSDVTTGSSPDYPHLRAHIYFAAVIDALESGADAIGSLPRWRVIVSDLLNATLHAEVEAPLGGFISDVTVVMQPLGDRHTRVLIRSQSRVPLGDLGENARNIRILQDAMDARLIGG